MCANGNHHIERDPSTLFCLVLESAIMSDLNIEISKKDELIIELVRAEHLTRRLIKNVEMLSRCPEDGFVFEGTQMRPSYDWALKIATVAYSHCRDKEDFHRFDLEDYGMDDVVAECVYDDLVKRGTIPENDHASNIDDDEYCPYLDSYDLYDYREECLPDRWTELEALDPSTLATMLKSTLDRYGRIVEGLKKIAEM